VPAIVLATRNPGKVEEIRAILIGVPVTFVSLAEFPSVPELVEDGKTLEENALKKARAVHTLTGMPALADDSGLEVFHLDMQPGVFSARYAGEHVTYADNNRKLLAALEGVGPAGRRAQFRCVAALVDQHVEKLTVGSCQGTITTEARGSGGFGYDPLFIPNGYGETLGELAPEVKNLISHRSRAFRVMKEFLVAYYA